MYSAHYRLDSHAALHSWPKTQDGSHNVIINNFTRNLPFPLTRCKSLARDMSTSREIETEATSASSPNWEHYPTIGVGSLTLIALTFGGRSTTVVNIIIEVLYVESRLTIKLVFAVDGEKIEIMASVVHSLDEHGIPRFEDLPLQKGDPPHSAWGLYGKNDELGTLNRLTNERVMEAAKAEIQTGVRLVFLCVCFACLELSASL